MNVKEKNRKAIPIRYGQSGKVNPEWLSTCKEERNLMNRYIVNSFKETAVHVSTYGGVRGRQSLINIAPTLIL